MSLVGVSLTKTPRQIQVRRWVRYRCEDRVPPRTFVVALTYADFVLWRQEHPGQVAIFVPNAERARGYMVRPRDAVVNLLPSLVPRSGGKTEALGALRELERRRAQ